MQQGTVAHIANPDISVPRNRELSFRLNRWHVDRKGQSLILHGRANVAWLSLDRSCVTQLLPLLREVILRDIFTQKVLTAWHPATVSRVVVSLLLPGSMEADEIVARKK